MRAIIVSLITAFALLTAGAAAAKEEVYQSFLGGVAIDGTDPVAYFTDGAPVEGSSEFEHEWNGATWRFASAENRDKFAADPEAYAPQYGGYCAWGIAKDRTVGINPTIFRIFDDKLYLNLNMTVHRDWLKKRHGYIATANEKWPAVLIMK